MKATLENATSVILTAAAIVIAGAVVHREFAASAVPVATRNRQLAVSRIATWDSVLHAAIPTHGDPNAPVKLVVFNDLECPYCRHYVSITDSLQAAHSSEVSTFMVHFPLSAIHRFADVAARAAECASREGRFVEMLGTIYHAQDSLGLLGWGDLGSRAGVRDTSKLSLCVRESEEPERIRAGKRIGESIGVMATPTVIVNGWLFSDAPSYDQLARVVDQLLHGQKPTLKNASKS
jgi:protein-disulfide isomerase